MNTIYNKREVEWKKLAKSQFKIYVFYEKKMQWNAPHNTSWSFELSSLVSVPATMGPMVPLAVQDVVQKDEMKYFHSRLLFSNSSKSTNISYQHLFYLSTTEVKKQKCMW